MVPLNMTYLHCLQHSLFEHLFNLYYIKVVVTKHPYILGSPYGRPGIVVCEIDQIVSKYVIKKLDKIEQLFKYWSVVNILQMYM